MFFTLPHDSFNNRTADTLDRRKCVADSTIIDRKTIHTTVNIRWQDLDSHLTADRNILCNLVWHFYNGCHQRSHKFYRIIIFQIRSLIGNYRISCCMGFIKCILGKIRHLIVDFIRDLLGDSIGNTSRNPFFHVTVNKILTLFCHDRSFFL